MSTRLLTRSRLAQARSEGELAARAYAEGVKGRVEIFGPGSVAISTSPGD